MSSWTHVFGTVLVSVPGRTQAEKRYILETVLSHLPMVTGSEEDMSIHIVQCNGFDTSMSCDEFGISQTNQVKRRGWHTLLPGYVNMQSDYIVVVEGHLRNRIPSYTVKEFSKWLFRLCKRLYVLDVLVSISGYTGQVIIRENPDNPFFELFDSDHPWYKYLMWDSDDKNLPYECQF